MLAISIQTQISCLKIHVIISPVQAVKTQQRVTSILKRQSVEL